MLTALVALAALLWWWPSFQTWGAAIASLLAVWTLWLFWSVANRDRPAASNPMHVAVLVLAGMVLHHLVGPMLKNNPLPESQDGAINTSVIFCLAMLSLTVMLSQGLLKAVAWRHLMLSIIGMAMMAGPVLASQFAQTAPIRPTLAMIGFAGACVWMVSAAQRSSSWRLARRWTWILYGGVAALGVLLLAMRATQAVAMAALLLGVSTMLWMVLRGSGWRKIIGGLGLAVAVAYLAWLAAGELGRLSVAFGPFGQGENAFSWLQVGASGFATLAGMAGWVGLAWFILAWAGAALLIAFRARASRQTTFVSVLWTAAAIFMLAAWLSPMGPFVPSVLLTAGFVWGLMPEILGSPTKPSRRWVMLVVMAGLLVLLGLSSRGSLLLWASQTFMSDDKMLHGVCGFLMAAVLAWYMGRRSVWLGMLAVAISVAAGAAGEVMQWLLSSRGAELADFIAHMIGSLAAALPYLLTHASQWCESSDAPRRVDYSNYIR